MLTIVPARREGFGGGGREHGGGGDVERDQGLKLGGGAFQQAALQGDAGIVHQHGDGGVGGEAVFDGARPAGAVRSAGSTWMARPVAARRLVARALRRASSRATRMRSWPRWASRSA